MFPSWLRRNARSIHEQVGRRFRFDSAGFTRDISADKPARRTASAKCCALRLTTRSAGYSFPPPPRGCTPTPLCSLQVVNLVTLTSLPFSCKLCSWLLLIYAGYISRKKEQKVKYIISGIVLIKWNNIWRFILFNSDRNLCYRFCVILCYIVNKIILIIVCNTFRWKVNFILEGFRVEIFRLWDNLENIQKFVDQCLLNKSRSYIVKVRRCIFKNQL